ncbi:MAG TPA: hypothetical protein DET40_17205 [Lentisphaeria bacterium]|nr:MAG: hypothetical protein A2X45_02800 [Lentisphaerae bacterium GWF2_50_93]HCE45280.1 hypothetical protein [Lentisphaeria bacterium]
MYFTIIIFAAALLFLLAGALPCPGGDSAVIFRSPVFIALLGIISTLSLYCCWKNIRNPYFLASHLGAVIILSGAFISFLYGKNTQFNMPVMSAMLVDKIPAPNNGRWELGFSFSVADFKADYYKPDYTFFIPDKSKEGGHRRHETFSTEKATVLDFGKWGSLPVTSLLDEKTGKWTDRFDLENGCALLRENPVPKDFEAKIRIVPKNGSEFMCQLKVNRPVSYNGWRLYLVSFGNDKKPYVQLSAKNDAGRGTVIAGIWVLMAGTFISCFKRKERFEDDKSCNN